MTIIVEFIFEKQCWKYVKQPNLLFGLVQSKIDTTIKFILKNESRTYNMSYIG